MRPGELPTSRSLVHILSALALGLAIIVGTPSAVPLVQAEAKPTPSKKATATAQPKATSTPVVVPYGSSTSPQSTPIVVTTKSQATPVVVPYGSSTSPESTSGGTTVILPYGHGQPTPTAAPTPTRSTAPTPTRTPETSEVKSTDAASQETGGPTPSATSTIPWEAALPGGGTVAEYYESQARSPAEFKLAEPAEATPSAAVEEKPVEPSAAPVYASTAGVARLSPSLGLSGFWKVMRYRDLIQRSAELTGADPAIVAALMEVEGSGEGSVSPAGAMGLMQLMPDKFRPGDDPFDPPTNLLRAAQHIRLLQDRWKSAELVAAAYFGAIDSQGNVTGASDGNIDGFGYVEFFRAAYRRYADGLAPLPLWLVSPFGDLSLTSDMIKFGFLGDYGQALAQAIRGEHGVAQYGTSHLGLDLQIPGRPDGGRGAPVVAPFEGRVIRTSDPIGGPFGIWLESNKLNLRARLMHMDGLVKGIETGVEVKPGQQLGILGAQGTEGFPHLHLAFERLSDGQKINPALFYRLKDSTDPSTMTGRWYEGLPDRAPSLPAGGQDTRMIPVGEGQPATLEPIQPVGIYVGGDFNEVALERFSVEALVPSDSDDPSAAEPTWRSLFEEGFANNRRGWPNQPGSTAWLDEGAYRLFARQPDRFVAVSAPMADLLSDVLVSGTFRKLGGPPGGNYGLVLRDQGPSSRDGLNQSGRYYVFVVRDVGEVGIYRRETDRWITVQPWTPSEIVHLNGESNELAVRALGPRLTFLVNGAEVATVIYRETAPLASRWGPFHLPLP